MISNSEPRRSFVDLISIYRHPRVLTLLFLGFSAGLPFLLVFSTLSAWLRTEDVSRSTIGFFSWIGITYSIKVFWAPIVDSINLPLLTRWLGRRRSWMFLAQIGIAAGLVLIAFTDPQTQLFWVAVFGLLVAFSSATQDITIDAYRIESAPIDLQGAMAASYILGYRLALLMAGAGALYIADISNWPSAYLTMAASMLIGIVTTVVIHEPETAQIVEQEQLRVAEEVSQKYPYLPRTIQRLIAWFVSSVINPFADFFKRNGLLALIILLFISVFRISDITMGVMANPFYIDLGFNLKEIAVVTKFFGFFMTILGAALGGILVIRFGLYKPLLLGAVMVVLTNLLFAWLATSTPNIYWLAVVISADNISAGIAVSAFIAYLSSLTNTAYTATQYALFSSLMTLPAKFLGGFSGVIVDGYGYVSFFAYAAGLGIPAILLIIYLATKLESK